MKPGCHWSFWTVVLWTALKCSSWSQFHLYKNLINFYSKYIDINVLIIDLADIEF